MKKTILFIVIFLFIISCNLFDNLNNDNSDGDEAKITIKTNIENVIVEIYEDGGSFLGLKYDTLKIGNTEIQFEIENPYYNPPKYYFYAYKKGYYTNLYKVDNNKTIEVNLDLTDTTKFCGTVFFDKWEYSDSGINEFADEILGNQEIIIIDNSNLQELMTFMTNDKGRFVIDKSNLLNKNYHFAITYQDSNYTSYNDISDEYNALLFNSNNFYRKPNIYICPTEETNLNVKLNFAQGGKVVKSIPEYDNCNGWENLTVKPDGTINDKYEFLFYEAVQLDKCQYKTGWIIEKENLETFFKQNLLTTGFNEKEINDFVEYWVPRLNKYNYYALYPQYKNDIDKLVKLEISEKPDNILRLFYVIDGIDEKIDLTKPNIPEFDRSGFVVTEWGGILK